MVILGRVKGPDGPFTLPKTPTSIPYCAKPISPQAKWASRVMYRVVFLRVRKRVFHNEVISKHPM